jgi:hypothetical protein
VESALESGEFFVDLVSAGGGVFSFHDGLLQMNYGLIRWLCVTSIGVPILHIYIYSYEEDDCLLYDEPIFKSSRSSSS